jgi:tagatose-1,6-bisphosphate aldolase
MAIINKVSEFGKKFEVPWDLLTSGVANQSFGPTIRLTGEVTAAKLYSGGLLFPYLNTFLINP